MATVKITQVEYVNNLNREIKEQREAHKREIRNLCDKYGILPSVL